MCPWGNVGVVWGCWGSWCTPGGTYGDGLGVLQVSVCLWGGYKGMAWGFDCPPAPRAGGGGDMEAPSHPSSPTVPCGEDVGTVWGSYLPLPYPWGRPWGQPGAPNDLLMLVG